MGRRYWNINLEEMIEVGVHFDHGTNKWNPRMAPYISANCKGIDITNLTITANFLAEVCDSIFDAASRGKILNHWHQKESNRFSNISNNKGSMSLY